MTDNELRRRQRVVTLDIDGPTALCGACGFMKSLCGSWSVEDGRLVWRADPDPLQGRGANLTSCCETGRCPGEFRYIEVDGEPLTAEQIAALRATVEEQQDEMHWEVLEVSHETRPLP